MSTESIPDFARSLIGLYVCVLAPGQAWWRGRGSAVPRLWAQTLLSVLLTTAVAGVLAGAESFSLASVVLINAAATLAGFLYQLLFRGRADDVRVWHDRVGPLLFLAALAAYWPPYPTFISAADSSAYLQTGVSLARSGRLSLDDDLAPLLPLPLRHTMFDSMSQIVGGGGPPFRRTPGALLLNEIGDSRAWPAFFPVPSLWAALATEMAGARAAPAYATLFAALAVWTTFVLARRWMSLPWAVVATLAVAANGAAYYFAHFAMSEPLAWYFTWAALVAIAAHDQEGTRADAALAAAAFGAAILTRIDVALFLAGALALRSLLAARRVDRPLPPAFYAILAVAAAATAAEVAWVPGSYVAPLTDNLRNGAVAFLYARVHYGVWPLIGAVAGAAMFALAAWRFGLLRTLTIAGLAGFLIAHAILSTFLPTRTPQWLSFYVGWGALPLAAAGAWTMWRQRHELPGSTFFLALLGAVSLVLFYNPHVHPALPWGLRRFVPILLPGMLVLSVFAASVAWRRSRLLAAAAVAVLALGIVDGGRSVWGKPFFAQAVEQLDALEAVLPRDGVVIINRTLSSQMLGPALWMLYGRNNLSVYPDTTKLGRDQITSIVLTFRDKPVYFVTGGIGAPQRMAYVQGSLLARTRLHLLLLEPTVHRRPDKAERYLDPIAIYKLSPTLNIKGEPIR